MEIWGGNRSLEDALSVPGIDMWVLSQPHGQSTGGGDIHYVSMCGGGKIARFAVADVAGHGATVDGLAVSLRRLMRKHINRLNQAAFARSLNREFSQLSDAGRFATAILATYYAPTDHLVTCNAGHPPPLWYRADRGQWQFLQHDIPECVDRLSNLPLGIIDPTSYHQFAVRLARGDLVVIYTDSMIEAASPSGELLEPEGLLRLASRLDVARPDTLNRTLYEQVVAYHGGQPLDDDATLLLLHHNAADPPRQSIGEFAKVIGKMLHLVKV